MYKNDRLSDFFFHNGLIIYGKKDQGIFELDYELIVQLFEKHGIILFRDFDLDGKDIKKFSDRFTNNYSQDAQRRSSRFGSRNIRNVDYGFEQVDLHSEASFSPSWPEVIWFFCNKAPRNGGETIFCDGIELWKSLSSDLKGFFLSQQIHYKINIPVLKGRKKFHKSKKNWLIENIGSGIGFVDKTDGCLKMVQKRYAVNESRFPGKLAFANHLLVEVKHEPQLLDRTISNNRQIPKDIYKQIKEKASCITYAHKWENRDLLMIDNKRFLHGRKQLSPVEGRDIVILQTKTTNFGYGVSTKNI